jgi:hypothetical protein
MTKRPMFQTRFGLSFGFYSEFEIVSDFDIRISVRSCREVVFWKSSRSAVVAIYGVQPLWVTSACPLRR